MMPIERPRLPVDLVYFSYRMVRKMSRIKIELEKVLKERKISKNQLCYACKLQHTQLNNYCKNKVVRVDLPFRIQF